MVNKIIDNYSILFYNLYYNILTGERKYKKLKRIGEKILDAIKRKEREKKEREERRERERERQSYMKKHMVICEYSSAINLV